MINKKDKLNLILKKRYLLLILLFIVLFFTTNIALAVNNPCPEFTFTPPFEAGLACLILWLFHFALLFSGVLLFTLLLINGIKYSFSFGDAKKLKEIRANIKSAFLGIIILFFSTMFLRFLNPGLLQLAGKADIDLQLSLASIVPEEELQTKKVIFFNVDDPIDRPVMFSIHWKLEQEANKCKALTKMIPRGASTNWEENRSKSAGLHSFNIVITTPQVGSYLFALRCYDKETGISTTDAVTVNLRPLKAQLSSYKFRGNHNCDDNPENCCPAPIYGHEWTMCDKKEIKEQPNREIIGAGRGWMAKGGEDCNGWNNDMVDEEGDIFNPIEDITMFHRSTCDIPHHVWCCLQPKQ